MILDVSNATSFCYCCCCECVCVSYQMSKNYSEMNQKWHTSTPTAVCTQSTAAVLTHLMLKAPPTLSLCCPDGVLVQHKPHMNHTRKTSRREVSLKKHNVFITSYIHFKPTFRVRGQPDF